MVGNISPGSGSGWLELLRSKQADQENTLQAVEAESGTARAETVSLQPSAELGAFSNPMSRNFASAGREESKYAEARKAGQAALNKQATRQLAILSAGLAELNAMTKGGNAMRSLIGRKAARRMLEEGRQGVREESERNLAEIKENIERKTEEATAPKDENGRRIENLPGEKSGEAEARPAGSSESSLPAHTAPDQTGEIPASAASGDLQAPPLPQAQAAAKLSIDIKV